MNPAILGAHPLAAGQADNNLTRTPPEPPISPLRASRVVLRLELNHMLRKCMDGLVTAGQHLDMAYAAGSRWWPSNAGADMLQSALSRDLPPEDVFNRLFFRPNRLDQTEAVPFVKLGALADYRDKTCHSTTTAQLGASFLRTHRRSNASVAEMVALRHLIKRVLCAPPNRHEALQRCQAALGVLVGLRYALDRTDLQMLGSSSVIDELDALVRLCAAILNHADVGPQVLSDPSDAMRWMAILRRVVTAAALVGVLVGTGRLAR